MRSGSQTELVSFYSKEQTPDGGGGYTEPSTTLVRTVWGSADYITTTDAMVSQQLEGRQRLKFVCPYYSDIIDTKLVAQFQGMWWRLIGPPRNLSFSNRTLQFVLEELQASSADQPV
jgi:hypothetical protein